MPGRLNLYNLGSLGVNVDKNPIQLEDGELSKAQNATHDAIGSEGGLRKREGLTKINSVAAAGSLQGAAGIPLPRVATRTFIAGRYTGTTPGWNTSTDDFATSLTTGGPDGYDVSAVPRLPANVWTSLANDDDRQRCFSGRPMCRYKNRLYYAGNDYTVGTTPPTIRVYDGTIDYVLTTIPYNPDIGSTTQVSAILCMITANNRIYLSTYDGGSYAANGAKGRIFEIDPENGSVLQVGSRFPISPDTARIPYAMAWYLGRLWIGTFSGGVTATQRVYFIRPGIDDDWTQDSANAGANGPVTDMVQFQGQLYFATMADSGAAVLVRVRNTTGTYSTSLTVALNEGGAIPIMSDFGKYNHMGAAIVFEDALYMSYFNKNGADTNLYARIYKYDGTSWTIPFSPAANATTAVPYSNAFVHNGKVYFVSAPSSDTSATHNVILSSDDGATWTEIRTVLDDISTSTLGVITS